MNKIKKLFNSILISLLMVGCILGGTMLTFKTDDLLNTTSAALMEYDTISNSLPEYVKITTSSTSETTVGQVDNTIYLFQTGSSKDVVIGSELIERQITTTVNGVTSTRTGVNYVYYPKDENGNRISDDTYYYFDFSSSLSLYYNLTNEELLNGALGTSLMLGQQIGKYAKSYLKTETDETTGETKETYAFVPENYSFTPQQLDVKFNLDTSLDNIKFTDNIITLNREGCYTLAIPLMSYYTDNNGVTFTAPSEETVIYYTFMAFNANTYFNSTTGLPNFSIADGIQQSTLAQSNDYSRYYFYNFSYGSKLNNLPIIKYNPNIYQLKVNFTDLDENIYETNLEYSNGQINQLNELGNPIAEEDYFVDTTLSSDSASLIFTKLGVYDISIQYLYKTTTENGEITYRLPLENINQGSTFKNKAQRMYVYGYQAVYSDYSNIDSVTNQPKSVELKSFDFTNENYYDTADITSGVTNYISNNGTKELDNNGLIPSEGTGIKLFDDVTFANTSNPSSSNYFNTDSLKRASVGYILSNKLTPVSTNQTPIKFLTNAELDAENSYIYKVNLNDDNTFASIDKGTEFQGFNQNSAGTYLYVIEYKYDNFMHTNGTLQAGFYHYQMFYFTVTNTNPSVTVLDENFNEIYTSGYTNKDVYILNNSENNIYDAKVTITLSARNYETGNYFFEDRDITKLADFGIIYKYFEKSENKEDNVYNTKVAEKYGILIENDSPIANAYFTIKILTTNSDVPIIRNFTIDTNEIGDLFANNVTLSSSTTYRVGDAFSSYNTNQPMIFSWNEKKSGAPTYGYVKYIPMESINYYSSQTDPDELSLLLLYLIQNHQTLPVSYTLDLAKIATAQWTEYNNSLPYTATINASYVKSNSGLYILEVYDDAGNSNFEIFLLDNTSPIFVQRVQGSSITRQLIANGESISVPEASTNIYIEWAKNKAIYLTNSNSYTNIAAYRYGKDVENATAKLNEILNNFFNSAINDKIDIINDLGGINVYEDEIPTGIPSYNGSYLIIPIENTAYLKDATHSTFSPYNNANNEYRIRFTDDNDKAIEGTYRFLLRDASNTHTTGNPEVDFKNYPSSFLTFNVTSDASKMMVVYDDGSALDMATYSLTGNLYNKAEDSDAEPDYTHLTGDDDRDYDPTTLAYKFAYYTPINAKKEINLEFIPVAENGSTISSIILKYYPFKLEHMQKEGDPNYYYYYDIDMSEENSQTVKVFPKSNQTYDVGEVETFDLALGTSDYPKAGRYVIERTYSERNKDEYDYFRRTLSFNVDDYNLISDFSSVVDDNGNSSLESVIGGDIILSMYSGDNNSSIEISFPRYNQNGLNVGSFYTQESFTNENENLSTFAVEGNKLPMSLYIPKYKYTVSTSTSTTTKNGKIYSVNYNDNLSYYGNGTVKYNEETNLFDVYVEGLKLNSFISEDLAYDYLNENVTIAEYEIFVEVMATINGNRYYYYSNGSTTNGYLRLYQATGKNGTIAADAQPVEFFYQKGDYVVTIYQANNIGSTSDFYSLYKFGFKVVSQEPSFTIIGSDGYEVSEANIRNTYYTNSYSLTIEWELPRNEYYAKIDESSITVNPYPTSATIARSEIKDGTNTRYIELDTSSIVNVVGAYITVSMQYEGFNSQYYNRVEKIIYFDKSAPTQTLQNLMTNTENATKRAFTKTYQELNMRRYVNYRDVEQNVNANTDLSTLSYSYSVETGDYAYYSYNVTTNFFNETLADVIKNANSHPYDTQFIYYRQIDSLDSYTQVEKSSFTESNYYYISTTSEAEIYCGYYEIVELDYAGNMVVYLVYVIDSMDENDTYVNSTAFSYINAQHDEPTIIENNQIINNFNVYSNSGFELLSLNYMSDPWAMFYVKIGNNDEIRYMKSPQLAEGTVYQVTFNTSGVSLRQVTLQSIFEQVASSTNKHRLTLTDRTTGTNNQIYLSIMDGALNTSKVEDPNKTSAILNISVPSNSQFASETVSVIYPTNIKIYQFDSTSTAADKWNSIMEADQLTYGTWTPKAEYVDALNYISFTILPTGTTLQIRIYLGINAASKVKYEITDNFGNVTTVIQLANETAYNEITGQSRVYQLPESDGSITYISDSSIYFSYNPLLYTVNIYNNNNEDVTNTLPRREDPTTNVHVYTLSATTSYNWNDYYRIVVKDSESDNEIKTLHIKIYYMLPYLTNTLNEVGNGGILFNDKNQQLIGNIGSVPNVTVNFNGKTYTSSAQYVTTYSQNVTVYFRNGANLSYQGEYKYQNGYSYSVYLSKDSGLTWENINSSTSASSGYTISGTGDYTLFVKYDSEEIFENLCVIYNISILDSSSSYYYITVDGIPVAKSNFEYMSSTNIGYKTNYVVSVNHSDKNNRLKITPNEELDVRVSLIQEESTGTNVYVEIYYYSCSESYGNFTIIYIEETDNIVSQFTYETASGTTNSIKASSSEIIVANKDTESNFEKLKINFTSFYGIRENKINIEILKLFNNGYSTINQEVYTIGDISYIYLERSGSYRLRLYDSCTPANVQAFRNSDYIDIIFLNSIPFVVTSTNLDGEEVTTEPIQKAVYNNSVTLSLTNLSSYYQPSGYPVISVKRNGIEYNRQTSSSTNGYLERNHTYTFSEAGFYSVIFSATSTTGVEIREEEFNFSIINKNESRYAFEFTNYSNYYISKVVKNGIDITDDLVAISNFKTIIVNGKEYLAELSINQLDEKTGSGRYVVSVCPNNYAYATTIGQEFSFEFWINLSTPPITISINEGDSTTDNIYIRFNVQNFYNALGDSYIKIGSFVKHYNEETIVDYGETDTIRITESGVHFIQIYTSSGHLLYSYKVEKTEPLNAFAIIAIVCGVIALGAIIGITIALRKRQKVK